MHNKQVIFTHEDMCVGCNKCNYKCPAIYANIAYSSNGHNKIKVDNSKCINCGQCLKNCDHNARDYFDDTELFFNDLKKGEKISIIAAPSIKQNFADYKKLAGYLKSLGANIVYDVAFGADISVWGYLRILQEQKPDFLIAQPCPVIVNYIEKYRPELIEHLSPVQSPALCTAIYLKKYKSIQEKIAFLSPCVAKIGEINDSNADNYVNYNVTYKKLKEYIENNKIDLEQYDQVEFDNAKPGLGSLFPMPGGLRENIEANLPGSWVVQVEGQHVVFDYLDELPDRIKDKRKIPLVIDILNCQYGCNQGTGVAEYLHVDDISAKMNKLKEESGSLFEVFNEDGIEQFQLFDHELQLSDFLRSYTNKSELVKTQEPDEEAYEQIYILLHKMNEASRNINCNSCGYGSCKSFVKSVINNTNHPSNCLYYNQRELEIEKQQLADKHDEIYSMLEEIRALNEEIESNEFRLKTIINRMIGALVTINSAGKVSIYNPAAKSIFGYLQDELSEKELSDILPNVDFMQLYNSQETNIAFETTGIRKDKVTFPVEVHYCKLMIDAKNKALFIIHDISERKVVETMKDEFVSMVSHELRTPITSIRASLGLLTRGEISSQPEKSKKLLDIANTSCVQLAHLLDDILDIQKIAAGKMDFNLEPVELISVLKKTVTATKPYAQQFGVTFEFANSLPDVLVNVDESRLVQVVTNLLSNAAKFSPSGESVFISLDRNDGMVRISVKDRGPGIPDEFKAKIFQKFAQADSSMTRKKSGTGLGLSICKAIVEYMGGKIGYNPNPDNVGTTFYFELPEL